MKDGQASKNSDEDSSEEEEETLKPSENIAYEVPVSKFSFYNATRQLMSFMVHQFFEEITILGLHNIPLKGPVIFCGNHNNQFVDGCILYVTTNRDVRFMVASKVSIIYALKFYLVFLSKLTNVHTKKIYFLQSMSRPVLGELFTASKAIPVDRA